MKKNKRRFPCVVCPVGCNLEVEMESGKVTDVSGNKCKRGIDYGKSEAENPVRIVTTTVLVNEGIHRVCPVRTEFAVPKDKISECMASINKTCINAPVNIGQAIIENVAGTGVRVIASRNLRKISR